MTGIVAQADIYTSFTDPFTGIPYPNHFITSDAAYRYLAFEEDESGIFPVPSGNPACFWNPASLIHIHQRYLSVGFDNSTEYIGDSVQKTTFGNLNPYVSEAYYIEPPTPYTIGVAALGWKQDQRNFDFSQGNVDNFYHRTHWSGGAVWAFTLPYDNISLGFMLGYDRYFDVKKDDWVGENYWEEIKGFYGKIGCIIPVFPDLLDFESVYKYGGYMNTTRSGPLFCEKEPTYDSGGDDLFDYLLLDPGDQDCSVKMPDSIGTLVRIKPVNFMALYGGMTKIFWSTYRFQQIAEDSGDLIVPFPNIILAENLELVPTGYYQDIVQWYGGVDLRLLDGIFLRAAVHTDPDPDQSSVYQTNSIYGLGSLIIDLGGFAINGSYIYGQGTSSDNSVNDTVQDVRVGVTFMLGGEENAL